MPSISSKLKASYKALSGGFTLVELLLVIAIIGVLAGIMLSVVDTGQQKAIAEDSVKRTTLDKLAQGIEAFAVSEGHYPAGGGAGFKFSPPAEAFSFPQRVYADPGQGFQGINPLIDSPDAATVAVYISEWPENYWYNEDSNLNTGEFAVHVEKSTTLTEYFKYSSVWGTTMECGATTDLTDVDSCGPLGSTATCGDGQCILPETCSTCASDCGTCSPPPPVESFNITPTTATINVGGTQKFTAYYSNGGPVQDVSASAQWSINSVSMGNPIASVSSNGTVTGLNAGNGSVVALYNGKTVTATITVTSVSPGGTLAVTPVSGSVKPGSQITFVATYTPVSGLPQNVSASAVWAIESSQIGLASVSGGVVTGLQPGTGLVRATYNMQTDTSDLTVATGGR